MKPGRILFHREFRGQTGGHGKVWNYFNHALALGFDARVHLADGSLADESNPWMRVPDRIDAVWDPVHAVVLFVGGLDWRAVPAGLEDTMPVVNLVQHVRHADPALPLRQFLRRRATRICVSHPVADAILATGEVNGDVVVVPAALDIVPSVAAGQGPRRGIFIDALKAPALGAALAARMADAGMQATVSDARMPRARYLEALAAADIAVLLPNPTEGFYLPALEAMALGCAVVTPPCVGSDEYARHGRNCLMPVPEPEALLQALLQLHDPRLREELRAHGQHTAGRFTLEAERAAFARVLQGLSG